MMEVPIDFRKQNKRDVGLADYLRAAERKRARKRARKKREQTRRRGNKRTEPPPVLKDHRLRYILMSASAMLFFACVIYYRFLDDKIQVEQWEIYLLEGMVGSAGTTMSTAVVEKDMLYPFTANGLATIVFCLVMPFVLPLRNAIETVQRATRMAIRIQRGQRSTRTAVDKLQLHEMAKVNFFASGEFHLQPLCDPDLSVIVTMDSVQEVDKDGKCIGSSELKTFQDRDFTFFDKETEKLLATGADDNSDDGARGDSISFSTDLDNGRKKVKVDAALVTNMGRVGSTTHGWQGFPGDFKFGIELSNWMWKESGAFLDMQMEIAPTGGKVLPTISNKTYMLGNDECLLELTNEYFEIDQFSNKKQMFMPPGFPKLISRGNGKQVLAFRFSKFENKVFYDPFIFFLRWRSGIFNVHPADDESNVHSVIFGFGYDLTIFDNIWKVILEATSNSELSAGYWHKCEVVGGGGRRLWLKRGQTKKYKIWQLLRQIDPWWTQGDVKVILYCRQRNLPVPVDIPPGLTDDDFPFDVFLSHDWGRYEDGRYINHQRVEVMKQALRAKGLRPWFDGEQMQGDMHHRMSRGIEQSLTVIVFVTKNYLEKVNKNGNDNCKFEFQHALNHRTVDNMIPVVMEDVDSPWGGPVGLALGNHLYYSFKTDDQLDECVNNLVTQINQRRQQT